MNLRKWFFLFWSCMAVGGIVTVISGLIMYWTTGDFEFAEISGLKATGFNAMMMLIVGVMFGAFSQMGFFAYLTLNFIALSVFRRSYLWNALQAYTTLFAVIGLGYLLFTDRENNWFFWLLPLLLILGSAGIASIKVKQTNGSAYVPTLFLMFVVTFIEAWPSFDGETNMSAIVFMMIPLFFCNAYQILMLHRLVGTAKTDSAEGAAKPAL
ncbi:KinB-signaling pathway activation protein [Paenibacillus sp. GCM10023252]|uniref:KinB-signaling pathway activation protein n=1 Tax=Paenibacillus sp. GCM10023252 TaxID=3252649 RepID=UPI0036199D68